MPELIGKIIDFLSKPINISIVIAIFLTSFFIFGFNFLPEEILIRMKLMTFLNDYNYIVFICLVGSFFFLIIQGVMAFLKKQEDKKRYEYIKEQQEKLFNDPNAYKILTHMYEHHPHQVRLPIHNQKVKLLSQFGLITLASNQTHVELYEDINNPRFPYILQPIAEERLKSIEELER